MVHHWLSHPETLFVVTLPVCFNLNPLFHLSHLCLLEGLHKTVHVPSKKVSMVLQVWCILSVQSITPALPLGHSEGAPDRIYNVKDKTA